MDILVAALLSARGFNATTARDQEMLGKSDQDQLNLATTLNYCILTHNRIDFEQLHTQYLINNQTHTGILIAKRKNAYEIAERVSIILDTLTSDEIINQLLYI